MIRVLSVLIVIAFLLGGCQVNNKNEQLLPKDMDPADLPEGRAFEDEFTRSFLQSTEEMMPGYYPFLSMNGKYTMGFPKEGLIVKPDYAHEKNQESLIYTIWEEESNVFSSISVKYYGFLNPGFEGRKKTRLETMMDFELNYDKIEEEDQTLYVSSFTRDQESGDDEEIYGYAGYLQNNQEAGGIYLIYTSYCTANCEELKEADLDQAYEWMKSVRFIHQHRKEGE